MLLYRFRRRPAAPTSLETDDVIPAIQRTAFDNQNFRGAKVEVVVGEGKGSSTGGPSTGQTPPTGSDSP